MAHYHSQQKRVSRRRLLRGSGVALALPLLDCMRPVSAAAVEGSTMRGTSTPRRSIFIYLPNGVNTLDYQILQSGNGYQFSRSLQPLARHRNN
ncbi:secreted protein containing DUF1552, partial [Rhodopirellula sallentina SM41]